MSRKMIGEAGLWCPRASMYWVLPVFIVAGVLAGCDGADPTEEGTLDERLVATLEAAAPGEGPAFFMLPPSDRLSLIPQDPQNVLTAAKVELGRLLFHETGLAVNPRRPEGKGTYACASCHHASAGFQAGRIQGIGEGGTGFGQRGEARDHDALYEVNELDVQPLRTPSTLNAAFQEVVFWNGQLGATGVNAGTEPFWTVGTPMETNHLGFQGLETQAIAGLVVHRMEDIESSVVATDETYKQMFDAAFPDEPIDRRRAGLAIAAYERTIMASEAPFQRWLRGVPGAMTTREKEGALLFFGKAGCVDCHTGPALNSMTFHALGMPDLDGPGVFGEVAMDVRESLGRGFFTGREEDNYTFKTPQLYNLKDSPFLGHGGTFNAVREVIAYKNLAEPARASVPTARLAPEFRPLGLTSTEVDALDAFVSNALYDPDLMRYQPSELPSGNCFPVNDTQSRLDLGCN